MIKLSVYNCSAILVQICTALPGVPLPMISANSFSPTIYTYLGHN